MRNKKIAPAIAHSLDLQAEIGRYQSDQYAHLYAPSPDRKTLDRKTFERRPATYRAQFVKVLRAGVNRAAKIAAARTQMDEADNAQRRKSAKQFLKTLVKIDELTAWLQQGDVDAASFAADLTRVLEPKPPEESIVPAVVSIMEDIRSIRAWHAQGFRLVTSLPNNIDLLGRHFVDAMVDFHEHYICKKPPASRSSVFAELLAASWSDLKFPTKGRRGREDLTGYLGSKLERKISRSREPKNAA